MNLPTVPQAAERLGLTPATIRFWIWRRRIGFVRLGRSVGIPDSTVREIIERGTVPARHDNGSA